MADAAEGAPAGDKPAGEGGEEQQAAAAPAGKDVSDFRKGFNFALVKVGFSSNCYSCCLCAALSRAWCWYLLGTKCTTKVIQPYLLQL